MARIYNLFMFMVGFALGSGAAPGAAATGTLRDVRHVVILVQENRSFDHYFGTMRGVRGFGDPAAPGGRGGRSDLYQAGDAGFVLPFATGLSCIEDVAHDWVTSHAAWNGGNWDRWIPAKGTTAMAYYTRTQLPFHFALAEAYTLCDAYYPAAITSTNPNRLYVFTGTLDPGGTTGGPVIDNRESPDGFTWTTYPERLQAAGISWKVYQQTDNYDDNPLAWFAQFKQSAPGDPLYDRGMARVEDLVAAFKADLRSGALPQVSWIVAPAALSEHPPYAPENGARLVQELLQALAAAPAGRSTVFMLTYDENGGFFDHLVPPTPPPGTPGEFVLGQPIGLGVRVPMILVSPWSRGGFVCSQVFDHTSIIRFLETWTGVREPNLSPWRRKICGDLTGAFDFAHPDFTFPALPAPEPVSCPAGAKPSAPAVPTLPAQEPGRKPARPLPYQLNANACVDGATGHLWITLRNDGLQAANLAIHSTLDPRDGPWSYDVDPGGSTAAVFTTGAAQGGYDCACYGPNGFRRRFAGNAQAASCQVEACSAIDPGTGALRVSLRNRTTRPVAFTLKANAHRLDGPWIRIVPAGQEASEIFHPLSHGQGWYDLTVTADCDARFQRVLAGHIETGQASVTE
jgi:phospholipase C